MLPTTKEVPAAPMQSEFHVRRQHKYQMLDITAQVADIVHVAKLDEGICSVYVTHATAAVVINENDDPNVCLDVLDALDKLIPAGRWRHDRVDGNAAAHIKAAVLGPGETIPVRGGRLLLGTWQAIMLVELDGPRDRRIVVTLR
jgi:secondary thiamine-phosphate synthase enzyme